VWAMGRVLRVRGDGSPTADTLYVCLQSSSGVYAWKPLASG
jgi:hypothetical protein